MSSTVTQGERTAAQDHASPPVRTARLSHWCHQCKTDITPMRTPYPMCPSCNSDFVEEIENDNHPKNFADDVDTGYETDEYDDIYNDLTGAARNPNHTRGGGGVGMSFVLGAPSGIRIGTSNDVPGGDAFMATLQTLLQNSMESGQAQGSQAPPRPQSESSGVQNENAAGHQAEGTAPVRTQTGHEPTLQIPNVNNLMSGENLLTALLQQALGAAMEGDGGGVTATTGGGGAPFNFSSFFNVMGNPGDYVFGQAGLDNIITTLMEQQQSQKAPPPATEQMIDALPRQKIGEAQVGAGYECAVCKDEYSIDDMCIRLPCRHTFHDDCIRPWLHVNGTCPTCRYSLIDSSPSTEPTPQCAPNAASSTTSDTQRWPVESDVLPQEPVD